MLKLFSNSTLIRLALILSVKSLFLLIFILYGVIGLSPDEAQYWTWSQTLDLGYYSKPPGIAWQIWLGTQLMGNTELGVRFITVFLSCTQSLAVYYLALACGLQARTAFWCAILMAFCPLGMIGSLLAITDGGFLLFWTLASICMARALSQNQPPNPWKIGLWILFGALFKWPIYIFWGYYLLFYYFYFPSQKLTQVLGGIGLSLVGLLPSVWWNYNHDWVTFRHVSSTLQGGHGASTGNLFEFLGSQILLLSPILFGLLILAYRKCLHLYKHVSLGLVFCTVISGASLLAMLSAALFQKIQGNWVSFAYPTAIILIGWYCCEASLKAFKWMKSGLLLSLGLICVVFTLPYFSSLHRLNPFKHNLGWIQLKEALVEKGYDANEHFLVSDKYQTTSLLSFYNKGQKRAYFLNLEGHRQNQFSYWPSLQQEQQHKSGYFVWVENIPHLEKQGSAKRLYYQIELEKYFENVEFLDLVSLISDQDKMLKGALIFKCQNCKNIQNLNTVLKF